MKKTNIPGIIAVLLTSMLFISCLSDDNGTTEPEDDGVLLKEDFEGDFLNWQFQYMVKEDEFYGQMDVSSTVFHGGSKSITPGAGQTAMVAFLELFGDSSGLDSVYLFRKSFTTVGLEFYLRADGADPEMMYVVIGKNAGSSGGLDQRWGFGIKNSNIIANSYDYSRGVFGADKDTILAPIIPSNWYKCGIEFDYAVRTISWTLDDVPVRTETFPAPTKWFGLDRVLIYDGAAGARPYYVDDLSVNLK